MSVPPVRVVSFTPASRAQQQTGHLGWLVIEVANLVRIDGVSLRRTADGRLALSFPRRRDARGLSHDVARPIDDGSRRLIEQAVLSALHQMEAGS